MSRAMQWATFALVTALLGVIVFGVGSCIDHERERESRCLARGGVIMYASNGSVACVPLAGAR